MELDPLTLFEIIIVIFLILFIINFDLFFYVFHLYLTYARLESFEDFKFHVYTLGELAISLALDSKIEPDKQKLGKDQGKEKSFVFSLACSFDIKLILNDYS